MSRKSLHDEYAKWQIKALFTCFILVSPCIIIADGIKNLSSLMDGCARRLGIGVDIGNSNKEKDFKMRIPIVKNKKGGALKYEDTNNIDRRFNPQSNSPLFKLPPELRQQIFEELLGGYEFYITFDNERRKMVYKRYRHDSPRTRSKFPEVVEEKNDKAFREPSNMLLGIVASCQKIYKETISIIYSHNIFIFERIENVLQLSLSIPPEHMAMITGVKWTTEVGVETTTPWLICRISENEECACIDHIRDKIWRDVSYIPALFQLGMLDDSCEDVYTGSVSRGLVDDTQPIEVL